MTDVKEQIKNDYLSGIPPKKLAGKYDISLNTIKSWIKRYGWSEIKKRGALSNTRGAPSDVSRKRKQGGQPGNKNAVGGGAPEQNKNAEKYGFFSKYLPDETREIFSAIEQADPLDLLWHQIQIAYAAIVRAQRIAYVKDQDDKTIEKIEEKVGNVIGQKWKVQQAWDKQENFLKAQARAQGELRAMIKLFTEGVVQNTDGTIAYNLMQNDMVALRAVMRLGWEIPNPINSLKTDKTKRCPFAVLKSGE